MTGILRLKRPILTFLLLVAITSVIAAQNSSSYWMPALDGYQGTRKVEGQLLFYDYGGPDRQTKTAITGYTKFKAANAGDKLTITFTQPVKFSNSATHLYIYDGDCKYANGATGDPDGWKKDVPAGWRADLVSGSTVTLEFASGECSVLYYSPNYNETGDGWCAALTTSEGEEMKISSISALQDVDSVVYLARQNILLMSACIRTDGALNPLTLSSLTFSLPDGVDPADLTNLRCCYTGTSRPVAYSASQTSMALRQQGRNLVFSDNITLQGGANYFVLYADVSDLATPGHAIDALLSSVMIQGTERLSEPVSPPQTYTIRNMLLMQPGTHTYRIGDRAWPFYDDGGPDNRNSKGFSGTATFVPANPGERIRLNLYRPRFYTGKGPVSTGRNDVVKIYAGLSADPDSLLEEITDNTPLIVSAPRQALTMTFESVYYLPEEGFEALVSAFTPQPMRADSLSVASCTAKLVNAGSNNNEMLQFCIHTSESEPALGVGEVCVKAFGADSRVASASLYAYFRDDKLQAGQKIGEARRGADGVFHIIPNAAFRLMEGRNYFTVAFNLTPYASKGETVGCTLTGVKAGKELTLPANASFSREVENRWQMDYGWETISVGADWTCGSKPESAMFDSGYGGEAGDQTVTFHPATKGATVAMRLSDFLLTWPKVSSIVGPVFEILDGPSPESSPIWQVSKETAADWPREVIRATNTAGCLTVRFNPMGTRGETGSGFHASVWAESNSPVTVQKVAAFTPTEQAVAPGSKNEPLLGISILTQGTTAPPVLTGVGVNLKNSAVNIDSVALFTTGADADFNSSARVQLGKIPVQSNAQEINIPVVPDTLSAHSAYYWVTCDVKATACGGDTLDAALTSLSSGSSLPSFTDPDPDGQREIQRILLFKGGNSVVDISDALLFYDNGGADGQYDAEAKGSMIFRAPEGKKIRFTFRTIDLNPNDNLYIYHGEGTGGQRAALLWGKMTDVAPITSTAPDGALTVDFSPRRTGNGWIILAEAVDAEPLAITQIDTKATAGKLIYRGSQDNLLLRVEIATKGSAGKITLSDLQFDTSLSDADVAEAWHLLTSGNNEKPEHLRRLASSSTLAGLADCGVAITEPGSHILWLAADVSPDAPVGSHIRLLLEGINGITAHRSEEVLVQTGRGIHGAFTLGNGAKADYHSFKDLVADLTKHGVDGPVDIAVLPGDYSEQIIWTPMPGAGERNRITVHPVDGARGKVVLAATELTARPDTTTAVMLLHRAGYLTLRNLVFTTAPDNAQALLAIDSANNITVEGCSFRGNTAAIRAAGTDSLLLSANTFVMRKAPAMTLTDTRNFMIVNNEVQTQNGNGIGLTRCSGGKTGANSVVADGSAAVNALLTTDCAECEFADNILQNPGPGAALSANTPSGNIFTHNAVWGATTFYALNGSALTPAQWSAATGAQGDVNEKALYLADRFELKEAGNLRSGIRLSYAPADISGRKRPATDVTIGAAEFASPEGVAELIAGYPAVSCKEPSRVDVTLKANVAANARLIIRKAAETAPVSADFNNPDTIVPLRSYMEVTQQMECAANGEQYRVWCLLDNISGAEGRITDSEAFTPLQPRPAAATFELITTADTLFTDGSFRFIGFKVEHRPGAPGTAPAQRVAKNTGSEARITPANASVITADGFFVYASAPVAVKALKPEGTVAEKQIPACGWVYVSLRDLDSWSELRFTLASGITFFIDDFGGQPNRLTLSGPSEVEGEAGQEVNLTATVAGGATPYSLRWITPAGIVGATTAAAVLPLASGRYAFIATDAHLQADTLYVNATARGDFRIAHFEDMNIPAGDVWKGDTTLTIDTESTFASGSCLLPNRYFKKWHSWARFAASSSQNNYYITLDDQFNSACGGGAQGTPAFGIGYVDSYYGESAFTLGEGDEKPEGIYLTNTAWVRDAILYGDGMSYYGGGFAQGDYLRLIITATRANGSGASDTIYLADYRHEDVRAHYHLDSWQWFDLSHLGPAHKLAFKLESTKKNGLGMTTPAYFCFDGVGASCPAVQCDTLRIKDAPADVSHLFSFDPERAPVSYALLNGDAQSRMEGSMFHTLREKGSSFSVIVMAEQKGCREFARIPVFVDSNRGVGGISAEEPVIEPLPFTDRLTVTCGNGRLRGALYDLSGRQTGYSAADCGRLEFDTAALPAGCYMLIIDVGHSHFVKKVFKK